MDRMKTIALVGALAVVLLVMVAFLYALVAERDFASYAPTLLGFAIPVITSLFVYAGISGEQRQIHEKVNGNLARTEAENVALHAQVQEIMRRLPPEQAQQMPRTGEMQIIPPFSNIEGRHRQ